MLPNAPNPFNPSTTIRYLLPSAGEVSVTVYDARGRMLRRVFSGYQAGGLQSVMWNGTSDAGAASPSGTYFALVRFGNERAVSKLTVFK